MSVISAILANLEAASLALKDFSREVVFVGGSTTMLYVDDLQTADVRATYDVDFVIEVATVLEYQMAEAEMRKLGFKDDVAEDAPICRWKKGPLTVDMMPTQDKILGFSNKWYAPGFATSTTHKLPSGADVKIFTLPYFVASKFEALKGRGLKKLDYSQDLEDILLLAASRATFFDEVKSFPAEIKSHIGEVLKLARQNPSFELAVRGNLPRFLPSSRAADIFNRLNSLPEDI